MDAHDSDVCVNVVGKSLEAVRLLSNLGSGNAPDSTYVLAAYDQLTTAAYLLHQIIPWTKEEKQRANMASSPLSPNTMDSIMRPAGRSGVVVRCRRSCASGLASGSVA